MDELDAACKNMFGHTNWTYFNTLNEEERAETLGKHGIVVVVFYPDPAEEE